ncbi:hypothetical protein ACF073_33080 [Streptomyces sp. NPDC015171]|uniref:hypothetical protein n=1 Tax=Streptomyces sp. NPDC015171 TaxID=3364945 RepID=UPI0037027461
MAQDTVTLCLPPVPRDRVPGAVDAAMQAHADEWWDAWWPSSRDAAWGFRIAAGAGNDPRLVRTPRDPRGGPRELLPGFCDGGPRGLLDLDTPRQAVAGRAEAAWHAWRRLARTLPRAAPVEAFAHHPDRWHAHREQPLIGALDELLVSEGLRFMHAEPADHFGDDLGAFVREEVARAIPSNILVTVDGRRLESGPAGYFLFADTYLYGLDPDAYIVRLRVHC